MSSIDELEEFAKGTVQNSSTGRTNVHSHEDVETSATRRGRSSEDDLMGFRSNSVPRSWAAPATLVRSINLVNMLFSAPVDYVVAY